VPPRRADVIVVANGGSDRTPDWWLTRTTLSAWISFPDFDHTTMADLL